jgi:hypothetical protein
MVLARAAFRWTIARPAKNARQQSPSCSWASFSAYPNRFSLNDCSFILKTQIKEAYYQPFNTTATRQSQAAQGIFFSLPAQLSTGR